MKTNVGTEAARPHTQDSVLIVGAGPTGLVLALWLTHLGVYVKIIDKSSGPGQTSRALALHARTLELYRQLNLAHDVLAAAHPTGAVNLWVGGHHRAKLALGDIGEGFTPFPAIYMYPQDRHERLLVDRLQTLGVTVAWNTELVVCEDLSTHVNAQCVLEGGARETIRAGYLVGCDGASSTVRKQIGEGFGGGTYPQRFYVADIEGRGDALNGDIHVDLDEADFLAIFGMDVGRRARLVGLVRDEGAADEKNQEHLHFEDVTRRALASMELRIDKVRWFSTYRVHHRVADHFRKGRIFLAGDAGHVHSPVGGQGMNTGIGDAINLAWKLAAVLKDGAHQRLLDSYALERLQFAEKLVNTTDRVFTLATSPGRLAGLVRKWLVPTLMRLAVRRPGVRRLIFRTVSQTMLNYRKGPLAHGRAGAVHGGDRLPWCGHAGTDNHATLHEPKWVVHVYGDVQPGLRAWCERSAIPLYQYAWDAAGRRAGLARNAAYLIRPDTYVAAADPKGAPRGFGAYFANLGLNLSTS